MTLSALILAAGQGTRMRSDLPKVLHPLGGRPMVVYSVEVGRQVSGGGKPALVVGNGSEAVRELLGDSAEYVEQGERLGTGHAVMMAEPALKGRSDLVLVYYADMPLWRAETLSKLAETQGGNPGPMTLATVIAGDPRGFGRVVRDGSGRVRAIVEEAQATPEEKAIRELNVGAYCFRANWLWATLPKLPMSPKGEYYLTDLVGLAVSEGEEVRAVAVEDPDEALGINTRVHLAEAEAILRRRINRGWMEAGVTMIDPETTYIAPGVTLGEDTLLLPNTHLWGTTRVGRHCRLGPNTIVRDTAIGDRCTVECSVLEGAVLEDGVDVGPFAHLRKGAHLAQGVHMGNFGEVKNSYLGPGSKMGHFSYVGDATIGKDVNIGAGTVTCNFDGTRKHKTVIEDGVFVGSDTMLVAPVHLGEGSRTGAGSVVTKDIPADSLAVGMPARVIRRLKRSG